MHPVGHPRQHQPGPAYHARGAEHGAEAPGPGGRVRSALCGRVRAHLSQRRGGCQCDSYGRAMLLKITIVALSDDEHNAIVFHIILRFSINFGRPFINLSFSVLA